MWTFIDDAILENYHFLRIIGAIWENILDLSKYRLNYLEVK